VTSRHRPTTTPRSRFIVNYKYTAVTAGTDSWPETGTPNTPHPHALYSSLILNKQPALAAG